MEGVYHKTSEYANISVLGDGIFVRDFVQLGCRNKLTLNWLLQI